MTARIISAFLALVLIISCPIQAYACDERQTNRYVTEILFGKSKKDINTDDNLKMLLYSLYLCSEQTNNQGENKLTYLKKNKVNNIPNLKNINVNDEILISCFHQEWNKVNKANKKIQNTRKRILSNTVNEVFDIGWFSKNKKKAESFSELLYYLHIMCDYISDNPDDMNITVKGKRISEYRGKPYEEINGNIPTFTNSEKKTKNISKFSSFDDLGRAGAAFMKLSISNLTSDNSTLNFEPSGWKQLSVPNKILSLSTNQLYNRCHLIARSLCGNNTRYNLITGTRYLNEAMEENENKVKEYIEKTNNHVLYRATPVYKGDNLVASGVQLEGWSVEDSGKGICFNVYYYNVQPGITINYLNGESEISDTIYNNNNVIPFYLDNPTTDVPDLMFEIERCLKNILSNSSSTTNYSSMFNKINSIRTKIRTIESKNEWVDYMELKKCEYEYLEVLVKYLPGLLKKEDFFKNVF